MKKFFYSAAIALAFCATDARAAHFQASSVRVGPAADETTGDAPAAPASKKDNKKVEKKTTPATDAKNDRRGEAASTVTPSVTGKPSATSDAPSKPGADTNVPVGAPVKNNGGAEGASDANKIQPPTSSGQTNNTSNTAAAPTTTAAVPSTTVPVPSATAAVSLASIYRIGIGDVLDIRLLNGQDPRQSTLYPVLAGGVLDFPLLKDPLTVAGMTTDELAAQLIAEFRHRNLNDRPQVRVSVREYASHAVLVSGLAGDPGTKILRREAIPLYVVVAEAQPKPEAGRALIISHATGKSISVDLNDAAALNTLVQSGDVVSLMVRPPEYFYVGGEIGSPGQKDFHSGMTLTQALLASGGVTRTAGERVRVLRQGADGRLVSSDFNLREIEGGVAPDPALQPGDRIEVSASVHRK
jgi:protein involved in polysaccharide export with SLBB domain